MSSRIPVSRLTRRSVLAAFALAPFAKTASSSQSKEVNFVFISDVHACRMGAGLSPNCAVEGKTDEALLRHITGLNSLPQNTWPRTIAGQPTHIPDAGRTVGPIRGIVIGGDMTDDGGGQTAERAEGSQILQFSHRYQQGKGADNIHFPVYAGLGNHDLDQDGRPPDVDWYRDELRDYVRFNHEPSVFFKSAVPVQSFDQLSESYSWDWDHVHLIQLHRFGGDTRKGAPSALPWLEADLAANRDKPIILFQHYGWDFFSTERWDAAAQTFNDRGDGDWHWWTDIEQDALLKRLEKNRIIAIFHGHEHDHPMIYKKNGIDVFKPKAAFLGGFALARVTEETFQVAIGEVDRESKIAFSGVYTKNI